MSYDREQLRRIIEGALLAAGEALSVDRLLRLFEEHEAPEKAEIRETLQDIAASCEDRGFHLVEVASGWRFQVREDLATWVNRLWEEKPQKYSRALLETLALIAYRQPITRGDIEDVRGVAVSSNIIKTLVEREWIKVVGHRDVPGKPSLYATTRQFLDYFNLKSLDELPTLSELKDIDGLNGSLDLETSEDAETAAEDKPKAASEVEEREDDVETGPADDSVTQDDHSEVPVQEVEIPLELDDEPGANLDVSRHTEPTVEQEEFEAARKAKTGDDKSDSDDAEQEDH